MILAAGRGTRLGATGEATPKGLLEVGGKTLLSRSLDSLRTRGYNRFTIVTGHLGEMLRDHLAADDVRFASNEHYSETGSAESLLVALRTIDAPFLLLESDILYDPELLDAIDHAQPEILTVDPSGSGDEVYVFARPDGTLMTLGKGVPPPGGAIPAGELAGITWVDESLAIAFTRGCAGRGTDHYEDVFADCADSVAIKVVHAEGHRWREVDTPDDLSAAEKMFSN